MMKSILALSGRVHFITAILITSLFFSTSCTEAPDEEPYIEPIIDPCDLVDDANVSIDLMWELDLEEEEEVYQSTLGDDYFYTISYSFSIMRVYDIHTGELKLTFSENEIPDIFTYAYRSQFAGGKIFMHNYVNVCVVDIASGGVSFHEYNGAPYAGATFLETGLYVIEKVEGEHFLLWYDYQNQEVTDTIYKLPVPHDWFWYRQSVRLLPYTAPDNEKWILLTYGGGGGASYNIYYDKFSLDTKKLRYHKVFSNDVPDYEPEKFYIKNNVIYLIYPTRQFFHTIDNYDFHLFTNLQGIYDVDYYSIDYGDGLSLKNKKLSSIHWYTEEVKWECNNSRAKQIIVIDDYIIDIIDEGIVVRELDTGVPIKNLNHPGGQEESTREYELYRNLVKFDNNKIMAFSRYMVHGFQINY